MPSGRVTTVGAIPGVGVQVDDGEPGAALPEQLERPSNQEVERAETRSLAWLAW